MARYDARKLRNGMKYEISNEFLKVKADAEGAILWSVTDKDGFEYIWQGDDRYWNEHGIPDFHINVNLSVVQLLQKDVAETVARILKKTGVNPKNIVLEITESFAINDMDRVLDIIKGIKKLGPRIALDDFGTGYSSLNYIKQLPLDIIKVDKTFIDDIVEDEYAQAFIKLIVELSDTIDTDIIVEGVENEAQLNILKELGVDYIQGFYYGKPVPAYEFEKLNFRGKIDYENADKEW